MAIEMAVLVSPTEHASLWNPEAKIHRQGNFKCKCVDMGAMAPSCDTLWRLRPEFSLPVRIPGKQYARTAGRNSWMKFHAKRSSVQMLGLRMEDTYLLLRPFKLPPARDNNTILKCHKSDSLVSRQSSGDLIVRTGLYASDMDISICKGSDFNGTFFQRDQPIEEPWLLQSSLLYSSSYLADEDRIQQQDNSNYLETKSFKQSILNLHPNSRNVDALSSNDKRYVPCESNQPIEEPWLFDFSLFLSSNPKVVISNECVKKDATHPDQLHQVIENLFSEDKSSAIFQDHSVSRVILINSSVCTMPRIAVLEDGRLVELFLEPVKNIIQCGSIYLGVFMGFVPQGYAFVSIGGKKPAFMETKLDIEPFAFRPHTKEQEVNGSVFVMPEDSQNNSSGIEVEDEIDGVDTDDSLHDECTEDEIGDDTDIQEIQKENVNGSLPHHGELEAGSMAACTDKFKWAQVPRGTKIIVQVTKEGRGTKGPQLTAYPVLPSRFWVLKTRGKKIEVSSKISGDERTRLRDIARNLKPEGCGLVVRTAAAGRSAYELRNDFEGLHSTWKDIKEHAKSAALAADENLEGEPYVMLHSAMNQTLSIVQDYFSEKVKGMVVDSLRTYHEVTNYLQEKAPDLCDRVELYTKRTPLFDEYNIEEEISNMLSKSVDLPNGGNLVIEQTEALVSVDVNSGQHNLGQGTSREEAILSVNLDAATQIARELRLRDIGGIIVVDFIDMEDQSHKRRVYEEVNKAVKRDRRPVNISELSTNGIMEITRKRVRDSVPILMSEECSCCSAAGRVEALEITFSKIEREICRFLARMNGKAGPENAKSDPKYRVLVHRDMFEYLQKQKSLLSSSLKVSIHPKIARGYGRGKFKVEPVTDAEYHDSQNQVEQVRRGFNAGKFKVQPSTDEEYDSSWNKVGIRLRRPNPPRGKLTNPPRRKKIRKSKTGRK